MTTHCPAMTASQLPSKHDACTIYLYAFALAEIGWLDNLVIDGADEYYTKPNCVLLLSMS